MSGKQTSARILLGICGHGICASLCYSSWIQYVFCCQEQINRYSLTRDSALLEGWSRLAALLHECEPEVRRLIRRSINDWLEFRGEERQMKRRQVP